MNAFGYREKIQICGVTFSNVYDIIHCAVKHIAKDGVFVGEDSYGYPCFDSEDYANEDRRYWNFVFAKSKEELDKKMTMLESMPIVGGNYFKMNSKLYPMAYWGGDTHHKVEVAEGVTEENSESNPFAKILPKNLGRLDMVIAFDTTGSMSAYIEAVRKEVAELIPRLFKENEDLRLGIVAFGDYCEMKSANDFGKAYQCMPLTNNENELIKFVKESENTSGGDWDEFYELVIKKIVEESPWREKSTRAILLISDANPHPLGYSYADFVNDNRIDWREEAVKAANLNIKIDTVTIQNRSWYKELSEMTNGISVPFETGEKTARLIEAATMARGSMRSREMFDELEQSCDDMEMRGVFTSYKKERNSFDNND